MRYRAVLLASAAAGLFGLSTPIAKLLLSEVDPRLLAGLFYLGSGLGLAALRAGLARSRRASEAPLERHDLPWLAGAILFGGILGPLLLMAGLSRTDAATASLLLTFEGIATALISWFAFRENVNPRVATGMSLIVVGGLAVSWPGAADLGSLLGPTLVIAACVAWGIDNNLTRKVALADPIQIATLKGLVAGPVNIGLALAGGAVVPRPGAVAAAAVVGLLGYGLSLVLFIAALRDLGAARTSAYFSTAPFLGAAGAIPLNGEAPSLRLVAAGALMGLGVCLHLTEKHEHEHRHDPVEHTHRHAHDRHHRHAHGDHDPPGEPHSHRHAHAAIRHSHRHLPDSHHRHRH